MLDYLIQNAIVFDGINELPQALTVGIKDSKIAYVGGELTGNASNNVIDAKGLYLCPGFIDTHASTGIVYLFTGAGENKIYQGITTEIIGNCGTSIAPIGPMLIPFMNKLADEIGFVFNWSGLTQWFTIVENYGLPLNVGTYAGYNTLRRGVCGNAKSVSQEQHEEMALMLQQVLSDGALGISTGLVYAPGSFADTNEIIKLAKIASQYGGIYASHIRNERHQLEEAIEEAIEIGKASRLPVLLSHLKAADRTNWGKISKVIKRIETARDDGLKINFEVYPYTAVSTKLHAYIPQEILDNGIGGMTERLRTHTWRQKCIRSLLESTIDFNSMVIISKDVPYAFGKSIGQLSREFRQNSSEVIVDILLKAPNTWIIYHCMDQDDVDAAILWESSIICSDSWSYPINAPKQIGTPHPRTYGAFTRFLEHYAIKEERIPFGHAVRKITSYPAKWLKIPFRGIISKGYFADLVLIDPANIHENATYENPRQFSKGTEYVWVNGQLVMKCGKLTNKKPGKIIKRYDV